MSTKVFEVNSDKHKFIFCVKVKFQYLVELTPFISIIVLKRDWFANTNSLAVTLARGAVYLIFLQIFYPLQKVRTSDKRRSWLSDRWDSTMQKQIQFPNPRCHFGREREREREHEEVSCSRWGSLSKSEESYNKDSQQTTPHLHFALRHCTEGPATPIYEKFVNVQYSCKMLFLCANSEKLVNKIFRRVPTSNRRVILIISLTI